MSLAKSVQRFQSDLSEATTRNIQHTRPATSSSTPARSNTPKPGESSKRTHETAFASGSTPASTITAPTAAPPPGHAGTELLTQVFNAVKYLKEKETKPITFESLIGYLSLPNDAQKNIPLIKRALQQNDRVEFLARNAPGGVPGKDSFKYRPLHPVTNAEELKNYLASQTTALGIKVAELKDGWPDCIAAIDQLEKEGFCLVSRHKKDGLPRIVWADSPTYHVLNPSTQQPQKADADFLDVWNKTKLPASEVEIRNELEKAGLVPTSQVKEVRNLDAGRRKEKKRGMRKGGKTTNSHMLGILKDYSKR